MSNPPSEPPTEPEGELFVTGPRHVRTSSTVAKLFGALLMAVGGLIAILCGLCSATVIMAMLANVGSSQNTPGALSGTLEMVLLFGGVPIAVGVGMFLLGSAIYRGR